MGEYARTQSFRSTRWLGGTSFYAILLIGVFLLGFIPMWLRAEDSTSALTAAQRELGLLRAENALGAAVIEARLSNYESARVAASDFFTALRIETDKGGDSALSPAQRAGVQPLLNQRDPIITMLARGDPASVDELTALYAAYLKVMND
jgi:hypothetical protein